MSTLQSKQPRFRVGDLVKIRSLQAILATLDKNGCLDGLPFMPEMAAYCEQTFRVFKSAHKTCDTINYSGGLRMHDAYHLEGIRCNGGFHGDCQAGCLFFWKAAWLQPVVQPEPSAPVAALPSGSPDDGPICTHNQLQQLSIRAGTEHDPEGPTYVCQATQLLNATEPLSPWSPGQYWRDLSSRNVTPGRMFCTFTYFLYNSLINAGIGLGRPLRWFYDLFQGVRGGSPYPRRRGTIPCGTNTPLGDHEIQQGQMVRVKPYKEILKTLDQGNKNRGLFFDAEEVPFCGGVYPVVKQVNHIINEQSGKMIRFRTPAWILGGVYCQARYSSCRLFCPRSIYPLWRSAWLEPTD